MSDKNGEADLEPEQQRKLFVGGVNYKTTGVLTSVTKLSLLITVSKKHRSN